MYTVDSSRHDSQEIILISASVRKLFPHTWTADFTASLYQTHFLSEWKEWTAGPNMESFLENAASQVLRGKSISRNL